MCVHFVLIQQLFEPDSQLLDSTDDDAGIEDRDYGGLFAGYGGIGLTQKVSGFFSQNFCILSVELYMYYPDNRLWTMLRKSVLSE